MRREPLNINRLEEYDVVCLDSETTGLNWRKDRLFGVAIAALTRSGSIASTYVDVRDTPRAIEGLRREIPRIKRYVNANAKFDAHILRESTGGVLPFGRIECVTVRAALIDEHLPAYNLDALGKKYIGRGKETSIYEELAALFGGKATKEVQMKNLHRAPAKTAGNYAIPDAEVALELWLWQEKEIERQGLQRVWELERELTSVLIDIERGGVRVDGDRATKKLKEIQPERDKIIRTLLKKWGHLGINEAVFNSPKQKRLLFGVVEKNGRFLIDGKIPLQVTEAGNPSIDGDVLRLLAETYRDERAVLIHRAMKLDKAKQFLEGHILGHMEGEHVYPNYNQTKTERGTGTGTGRFSIEDPALQQIPKRDKEMASIVRPCFIPDAGEEWCCADWEQFEFRWFAHYTNDPALIETYLADPKADFHKTTADLTGLPRNPRFAGDANAKQINLGLVFGMGRGKLAAEMGLPFSVETMQIGGEEKEVFVAGPEAEAVFKQYHDAIPGVQKLLREAGSIAKTRGYVRTVMGRHLRFPHGKFTHKAGGLTFQGTSADCCKRKMIELYHTGHKQGDYRILLSVHDEFDFSIKKGDKGEVKHIKSVLETFDGVECPIKCRVPILSDVNVGNNWHEASA